MTYAVHVQSDFFIPVQIHFPAVNAVKYLQELLIGIPVRQQAFSRLPQYAGRNR